MKSFVIASVFAVLLSQAGVSYDANACIPAYTKETTYHVRVPGMKQLDITVGGHETAWIEFTVSGAFVKLDYDKEAFKVDMKPGASGESMIVRFRVYRKTNSEIVIRSRSRGSNKYNEIRQKVSAEVMPTPKSC